MATLGRDAAGNVALRSGAWLALLATATIAAAQPALPLCAVCASYQPAPPEAAPAMPDDGFPDWAVARHRAAVRETRVALGSVNPW